MDLRRWVLAAALAALAAAAAGAHGVLDSALLNNIANVSYASNAGARASELSSLFSPRMDFEQWKPLTGRGDPLRNDPTYDYEPPQLQRVHYWADERERPERKSEVLVLGVSSRKPSAPRPPPPRRHTRPAPLHYQDYSYKLGDHYPMTILVPPPPPPPDHRLPLFILNEDKLTTPTHHVRSTERPSTITEPTADPSLTSLYALQEANLIYQSSTTSQNWILDVNQTKPAPDTSVSSDYAGWGPTTPIEDDDDDSANETHNFIFNDHFEVSKHPYSFYRPMLSESPPPPPITPNPLLLPTFVPTALPPTTPPPPPPPSTTTARPETTTEFYLTERDLNMNEEITTYSHAPFRPTVPTVQTEGFLGMFGPMLSMPLVNGPERPEDNLYAHASENLHIFQETPILETTIESMQTMQPPPPSKTTESSIPIHKTPFHINALKVNQNKNSNIKTLDPYLHMRFTTAPPMPTLPTNVELESMSNTEAPVVPTYLIIQGHSKVKTYSSKNKSSEEKDTTVNEIPKPNETNEVKHLHPTKEKIVKKVEKIDKRAGRAKNLQTLVNEGLGSIEIQEADVGIKYDVSDGSEVPQEIYRKGIVESDLNDYSRKTKRPKRQLDLEDFLPFDEEDLEEYVFDFLHGKRNETGITGLLASAVTGDTETAAAVEEIEDDR